ncbi:MULTISPECIES: hypothetical protein [Methylomonas]|nr:MULTISPECIES: hypothetical protein [Methylomonas]ATG92155.1 hypothetical protein MKLM6_3980 [Methylomonas koyamae]
MARARKYSKQEVHAILTTREGLLSPVSNEPSHILSLHVGVSGLQISDRLMGTLKSDSTHPIIMGPTGSIRPESEHREIWKALNPGMNTQQAKNAFGSFIDNSKDNSGSFLDVQQAVVVGWFLLNSDEGQVELAKLDGASNRVKISKSLDRLEFVRENAFKMNFASKDSDITHLEDFSQAVMIVDKLPMDGIHVQTLYPVR